MGWDLKFVAHRLVFSYGIGVASLLATGAVFPAAVAATVAPFAGLFTFRLNHPAVFTVTYAPWILVGWFLLATAGTWAARWRVALLLTAATSLTLVASTPKEALIMLGACYATGALFLGGASIRMGNRLKSLLAAAAAALIALLLCTPHWLVFLDTLAQGHTFSDSPAVFFATTDSAIAFVLGNLTPGSLQPGLQPLAVGLAMCAVFAPALLRARPALAACAVSALGLIALAFGLVPAALLVQVPLVRNIHHFADVVMTALMVPVLVLAAGGAQLLYRSRPLRPGPVDDHVGDRRDAPAELRWWMARIQSIRPMAERVRAGRRGLDAVHDIGSPAPLRTCPAANLRRRKHPAA